MNRIVSLRKGMNMLKQVKWPLALVIISVALTVVVTFVGVIVMEIDKVTGERAVTVKVNSKEIDANVQLETEVKESKTYSTNISYPVTNIKEIDHAIDNWKKNEENRFKETIEKNEDKEDHSSGIHTLEIDSNFYKSSKHVYSILFTGKEALKNDKTIHFTDMFTFDLKKKKIIDLTDVININESFLHEITLAAKKLENEPIIDETLLKETVTDVNWHSWILHDDELSLFFNDNEVGNYDGNIEINLPFIDIYESITDNYYASLIKEEIQQEIDNKPRELDPNGKYIALTFDDGPDEHVTSRILDTLNEFDAKATFYMLSRNVNTYPQIAKRVADEGHEVANHSITHANLNTVTKDRIIEELTASQQQIETATGVRPETFRPPYGEYNNTVLEQAKETEQIISMWTVDTLDWQNRNVNAIVERIKHVRTGDIVLMHDIHHTTADALPIAMEFLQKEGFEFVTVMELIQLEDKVIEVGPYYGHDVSDEQAF